MDLAIINKEADLINLYHVLREYGEWATPRGETTLEIENFSYTVSPYVRFNAFKGRELNISYLKHEMAWYVKANPHDLSIAEHAAQWGKIIANGKLNSNYGSYWFGRHGVRNIVKLLTADPTSRRAVIPMYGTDIDHMDIDAKDVPCTIAIEFRIRKGQLNARAIMRSQDILWGMANDLPTFSFLQEIIAAILGVNMGNLTVTVGSFHVYVRRMEMFKEIVDSSTYLSISDPPPRITKDEALQLSDSIIDTKYEFSKWLLNV